MNLYSINLGMVLGHYSAYPITSNTKLLDARSAAAGKKKTVDISNPILTLFISSQANGVGPSVSNCRYVRKFIKKISRLS